MLLSKSCTTSSGSWSADGGGEEEEEMGFRTEKRKMSKRESVEVAISFFERERNEKRQGSCEGVGRKERDFKGIKPAKGRD